MKKTLLLVVSCLLCLGSVPLPADEPPGETTLPIHLTEEEKLRLHEIGIAHRTTAPPPGIVRNPSEWEPSEGVIIRWPLGISVSLIAEMSEDVMVTTIVATGSQEASAISTYTAGGVNMANTQFIRAPTDSIWTRDYGPWFIFNDGSLAITDHVYNRPRPNDDVIPQVIGAEWGLDVFGMDLSTAGGNHMSDGLGLSAATELTYHENPGKSEAEIGQLILDYLGNDYLVLDYIQSGGIHHIDCWAKFLGPSTVMVKDVSPSHPTYDDLNERADQLSQTLSPWGVPYDVVRVYCPTNTWYTNSLILNDKVLVPLYGISQDDVALQTYRDAMPGYEVLGFTGSWASEDALHCRTMGVPDRGTLFIDHVPFKTEDITTGDYDLSATIVAHSGATLIPGGLEINYRIDGGLWQSVPLTSTGGPATFGGLIPAQAENSTVSYYLQAADESGRVEKHPYIGRAWPHRFTSICPNHPLVDVTPDAPYPGCEGTAQVLATNLSGGAGPFTYQWTEDGVEIPGATSSTYAAENTGTHAYNCRVWGDGCITARTDVEDVEVSWQAEPIFAGITEVASPPEETCSLDLAWEPAVPACAGPVYYNVYRSLTMGFIPGPGSLHIAGLAGVSHRDAADLVDGSRYYYVVRAEDDSNGAEEANTAELSGRPAGPSAGACTTGSACTMTVNVTPNGITSVCNGDDIEFTAVPNGGVPPYEYQWTKDGADLPGATGSSLTVSHVSAQSHIYNCRVADSDLCVDVIDGLDAMGEWASCTATVTVPDGSEGGTEPLRVGKDGDDLVITWDVSTPSCSSPGYHLIWGRGDDVDAYAIAGSDCTLDASGNHLWVTAPDSSSDWSWFLVVGNDGATTEGGWGTGSDSNQRSADASGECGTIVLDAESCIP